MKLTAPRKSLIAAIDACCAVADKNSANPLLEAVLLRVEAAGVTASASDRARAVRYPVADVTASEDGAVAVNARELSRRVHALAEGPVVLAVKDDKLTIRGGSVRYTLPFLDAADAPTHPKRDDAARPVTIAAALLAGGISRALPFAGTDSTRAHTWGVFIQASAERLRFCATDGHEVGEFVYPPLAGTFDALVPLPACEAIVSLCADVEGDVEIATNGAWLFVDVGGVSLACALCNAQFPPIDQVIPRAEATRRCVVSRAGMIATVKAAAVAADKESYSAKAGAKIPSLILTVDGETLLISTDGPNGSASASISCDVPGKPIERVGVNANLLLDGLGAFSAADIWIASEGELDPIVFRVEGDPSVAVVMPVRI